MPETHDSASAFDLPERLRRKADPALIAGDEARFAAIGAALAAEIGQGAEARPCDLSKAAEIAAAAEGIAADVLVNNAGILRPGPLEAVSEADWNLMLAVNLTGCLLTAQAFGRGMLERGRGALLHVASIAGSQPQPASGAYSASKAGVVMLSRQLAAEWGPKGVRSPSSPPLPSDSSLNVCR